MIIVHLDTERHVTLTGRVANIIRWIVEEEDRIQRPQKMTLTFDICGESVVPEVKIKHPAIKTK